MKIRYQITTVSKKWKHIVFLVFLLSSVLTNTYAQIGINPTGNNPDASAMLDVSSTNKGILIPRMTTTQKNNINSPANGLMVFDTDTKSFWYYDSSTTSWKELQIENTNIYNTNGTINSDRDIAVTNSNLNIVSDDNRGVLSLVKTDNANDLGIGFRNSGTSYTASIASPATGGNNNNGLDFYTIGTPSDLNNLGLTMSLKNNGSIVLPDYGQGNNIGTVAKVLAVDASGAVIETDATTNTDEQTLSLGGNNLSISNGNSVNLSSYMDNTDAQSLSLNGTDLSISGGNTIDISGANSNIYSTNGTISSNREIALTNSNLQLTSSDNRALFSLKRTDNATDLGIGFRNNFGSYGSSISMPANTHGLNFYTIGTNNDPNNVGLTMSLENNGSVTLPDYGQGNNTGTVAKVLAVDASGAVIETDATTNTDEQTLSLNGTDLSISGGNTVDIAAASSNIYSTNGTISSDRDVSFTNSRLNLISGQNRGVLALVKTDNANDLGISFRNSGASYTASIASPASGNGNDNGLNFYTIGTNTNPDNIGLTMQLQNNGSIVLPDYGQGNNTGTVAKVLAVDANGAVIETNATTNTDDQTLSLNGTNLSISGGNTIDISSSISGDATIVQDADTDTKIQVEETADEDIIRFDIKGDECLKLHVSSSGAFQISPIMPNENLFFGEFAGRNTQVTTNGGQAQDNTFIGFAAGYSNTSADDNTFVGNRSGYFTTTGYNNTFIGRLAGYSNTTGYNNVFIGKEVGNSNTIGDNNTMVGNYAGYDNTTGEFNTYLGRSAGENGTSAERNTIIGIYAGQYNITGDKNVFLGYAAGNNSKGGNNTYLGHRAGNDNINGSNNVFVGNNSGYHETGSDKLYIENTNSSSPLIYGEFDNREVVINGNASHNSSNYTFYVNGSAGGSNPWNNSSDRRLKENIQTVDNALAKINQMRGVTYEWKDGRETGSRLGFIAQEVEGVLPQVVDATGEYRTMQYAPITAVLVEAVKELSAENATLQAKVKALEIQNQRIDDLEATLKAMEAKLIGGNDVVSSDK